MTKCEIKYAPKQINDVVFNNPENERRLKIIFQGFKTRHLFLSGTNGVGKTMIADLVVHHLTNHCPCLLIEDSIEKIMAQDDLYIYFLNAIHFAKLAGATNGDRLVIVFHELDSYTKPLDKLWTVMDRMKDELLVIITTNNPMKFANAVRSRCAKYNFTRITPEDFVCRAQCILKQENIDLPDAHVLHYLKTMSVTTSDVRDYLDVLDDLIYSSQNNLPLPAIPVSQPKQPTLSVAK
jgi:replication-associated recombination protein RarA